MVQKLTTLVLGSAYNSAIASMRLAGTPDISAAFSIE